MELSSTLIGSQPDRTLCFPINLAELSLMGFQVYGNLYIQDLFQENIRVPTSVNMSSFGEKKRGNHITMRCCDQSKTFYGQLPCAHLQIVSRIKPIVPRWMRHGNIRNVLIGLCFLITTIIFNNYLVKIPYSKRAHFFLPCALRAESVLGELNFKYMERKYKGQILPQNHPTTIRVESILKKIIIGLNNGLNLENDELMTFSGQVPSTTEDFLKPRKGDEGSKNEIISSTYEEIFNKLNLVYSRAHLERRNWELMVVDTEDILALYILGTGRIVFGAKLIEYYCNSEAEIAYLLGHEIGHGLSLHSMREWMKLTHVIACIITSLTSYRHLVPYAFAVYVSGMWISRRMESVADYVGLVLTASAGYDPRAAPAVERRIDCEEEDFFRSSDEAFKGRRLKYCMKKMKQVVDFLIASHPSQERRARSIEEVMEEAVAIYEHVRGGQEEERSIALS